MEKTHSKEEIYSSFHIGTMEVALNVNSVQEVVNFPEKIIKMPLAPAFLCGVFNLRGMVIPIINLKSLLKFEECNVLPSQKVGIVDHEGAKIGLLFDSTSEILRVNPDQTDEFLYAHEGSHKVVLGAIKLDGGARIIQILDPLSLISIENMPQILAHQGADTKSRGLRNQKHENRQKCISFTVGSSTLGFEMSCIQEITKVPEVKKSALYMDICLGIVNLRGATVPIICMARLLGMTPPEKFDFENMRIVVFKLEKELFGLMVDSVESINTYVTTDVVPIPILNGARAKMFQGCISLASGDDIILLNHTEVLTHDEVLKVTQGHSKMYHSEEARATAKKSFHREAFISFRLDHLFGVAMTDVREIINYTEDVVSAPGASSLVKGVLNLRGKLVTIVDTRAIYGMKTYEGGAANAKILIFETGDEKLGLVVDNVESIVTVDQENKMKVPSMMVQNVQSQFENEIKEIVTFQTQEKAQENVLVILNVEPLISKVRTLLAS